MSKTQLLKFFRYSLLFPSISIAWSIGNPALPALLEEGFLIPDTCWSNFQMGFCADVLLQKRLHTCRFSAPLGIRRATLRGEAELAMAIWSIRERLNVQLQLGSGQFRWRWEQDGVSVSGFSRGGIVWGGDVKLIIFEVKDTVFAADVQAGGWDWMDGRTTFRDVPVAKSADSLLRYWQIAAGVAQRISCMTPYLGYVINHTGLTVTNLPTGGGKFHARHFSGPFLGCGIGNGSSCLFNMEYRGWFEEGLSLALQVRF